MIRIRTNIEDNIELDTEPNRNKNKIGISLLTDNYLSSNKRALKNDNENNNHLSSYISASKQIVTTASTPSEKKRKQSLEFPKIKDTITTRKFVHSNSIRYQDRVKIKKTIIVKDKTKESGFSSGSRYKFILDENNLQSDNKIFKLNRTKDEFYFNSAQKNEKPENLKNLIIQDHKDETYIINQSSNLNRNKITLVERLMHTNPYKDIPKKVKYCFFNPNQLEKKTFVNLPSRKLTKHGHQLKDSGTSSVLYKPSNKPQNLLIKLLMLSQDNPSKVFIKSVKMKSIKWIIKNKGAYVDLLINSYKEVKWFLNSKGGKLDKIIFNEFLLLFDKKGGKDQEFTDLIFLIFDENRSEMVDYKELIVWFILFNNDSILRKIENMIDICSIESSCNLINIEELFRLLKISTLNRTETKRLQEIIKNLSTKFKYNEVEKNILYRELISSEEFKSYICRNSEIANELENQFDEEIETIFNMNLKRSKYDYN
jgi:hypothetical protein